MDRKTVRAAFRGGVASSYMEKAKVRFWSGGRWINAKVRELTRTVAAPRYGPGATRPEEGLLTVAEPVEPNSPGMWDLAGPVLDGDLVRGIACDDLAGVAAMLALLARLSKKQAAAETYCLFTRAEEVGFIGAIGAAEARTVSKKLPIVAIETSKQLPSAPIGAGPILRVGDRASIFTPELTAWCGEVAEKLAKRRKGFKFQRKLMDGGTCESTAYVTYGYDATGLCLALGNYHNMNEKTGKLGSEYVSLSDWRSLVDWFEARCLTRTGLRPTESKNMARRFRQKFYAQSARWRRRPAGDTRPVPCARCRCHGRRVPCVGCHAQARARAGMPTGCRATGLWGGACPRYSFGIAPNLRPPRWHPAGCTGRAALVGPDVNR